MIRWLTLGGAIRSGPRLESLRAVLEAHAADDNVRYVVLDLDVPGGLAQPALALASYVYSLRSTKPFIAFVNPQATSSGYLLAAACSRIIAAPDSRMGSVKVKVVDADRESNVLAVAGRNWQGSMTERVHPRPDENLVWMSRQMEEILLGCLSTYRGIPTSEARNRFGEGSIFRAEEALARGMVDEVMSKAELKAWIVQGAGGRSRIGR